MTCTKGNTACGQHYPLNRCFRCSASSMCDCTRLGSTLKRYPRWRLAAPNDGHLAPEAGAAAASYRVANVTATQKAEFRQTSLCRDHRQRRDPSCNQQYCWLPIQHRWRKRGAIPWLQEVLWVSERSCSPCRGRRRRKRHPRSHSAVLLAARQAAASASASAAERLLSASSSTRNVRGAPAGFSAGSSASVGSRCLLERFLCSHYLGSCRSS